MLKYTVLTLFPEITDAYFAASIMARAVRDGLVAYQAVNIRDYAFDRHRTCDDAPYGGGPGMLMLPEPLGRALDAVGARKKEVNHEPHEQEGGVKGSPLAGGLGVTPSADQREESDCLQSAAPRMAPSARTVPGGTEQARSTGGAPPGEGAPLQAAGGSKGETCTGSVSTPFRGVRGAEPPGEGGGAQRSATQGGDFPPHVIYLSPSGRPFDQGKARELAAKGHLALICGRYEGIDQRIIDRYVDEELSVGDYVLSSGEAAALVVIDATYRLLDRVITSESLDEESFTRGLLEYPQYTRPEVYDMMQVPEVLLSGHHENIRRWRLAREVEKTLAVRPDLIRKGVEAGNFDTEIMEIISKYQF